MKTLIGGPCIDALTRVHGWGVRNPTRWGNGWRHRVLVVAGRWSRLMTAEACCSERPPHHLPQTKAGENTQEYRTYQLTPKPTKIPFIPKKTTYIFCKVQKLEFLTLCCWKNQSYSQNCCWKPQKWHWQLPPRQTDAPQMYFSQTFQLLK